MPDRGGARSDAQRNREAILRAAAEVLAEDPAASMDDVAARAGVGRATMYRHVTGRADLLHQLASWALASATRAVDEARIDDGPADAALRRVLDGLAVESVGFRALVVLGVPRDPESEPGRDAVLAPVVALIARGRDSGTFRGDLDPAWATTALVTLLQAAVAQGRSDPARLVWHTLVEGWRPIMTRSDARLE